MWGFRMEMEFPIVKLLDYRDKWDELEKSQNPFAVVVMAHLKTQETSNNNEDRKRWKSYLAKRLYERGYEREDIIQLLRFIDWIMQLPKEMENELWIEISKYEEEEKMQYITSVERIGIEKGFKKGIEQGREQGRSEGLLAGIESMLEFRFGNEGLRLMSEISKIDNLGKLRAINAALRTVKNLDELRNIYQ